MLLAKAVSRGHAYEKLLVCTRTVGHAKHATGECDQTAGAMEIMQNVVVSNLHAFSHHRLLRLTCLFPESHNLFATDQSFYYNEPRYQPSDRTAL
jgi:hypothetical protein